MTLNEEERERERGRGKERKGLSESTTVIHDG